MKRILSVLSAAALAIALTACDKANRDPESSGEVSSETQVGSSEQSTPVDGIGQNYPRETPLTVLCGGDGFMQAGCGTEDGFYSIQFDAAGGDLDRITYVDYASRQEVILCADSSCKHNTERCTSVLGADMRYFGELFLYGGHLYFINFDHSDEQKGTELYRMKLDGTGRELVYTFDEEASVEHVVVGGESGIWFIISDMSAEYDEETGATIFGRKKPALARFDLSEKKITEQIPIPESDNISKRFNGVCGGKFIFSGVAYPGGKGVLDYADELGLYDAVGEGDPDKFNKFMSKCEYAFFALDVNDKTLNEIYRMKYDDYSGGAPYGDHLYITEKNGTIKLDIKTGGTEALSVPDGYEFGGFVGGRAVYVSADGERHCFADPDTGGLTVLEDYKLVIAEMSDSALVAYDILEKYNFDGSLGSERYRYALITFDDLFNGRDNYKVIDMLGGK
ncbi:MAG: hypothetical protein HDR72_00170 [Ruminococcaceae bacterium]|nr:hypothetical protein [Oscillospiraceae bacterium]